MILLDANILLYVYNTGSPHFEEAHNWFTAAMERKEEIGLSWPVIHAFLRIVTSPTAYPSPYSSQEAAEIIDALLSYSNITLIQPTATHWTTLRRSLIELQVTHRLVMDADLAALAIEHGASLCTNDRDFSRFPGLKIVNPISRQ